MSSSGNEDPVEQQVIYYQSKLERYAAEKRKDSLLYCIHKLKHLPVTVAHLERTGVGKSVNMLRNYKGSTGVKSRALVDLWKKMVSTEEMQEFDSHEAIYNHTDKNERIQYVNLEDTAMSDDDDDSQLHIEMPGEYDSNGNNCVKEDSAENCYNPFTSQADYLSAGCSNQSICSLTEDYVPTPLLPQSSYIPNPVKTADYSPSEIVNRTDNLTNGSGSNAGEDSNKRSKSKHKSKDKSKHKHRHHAKDKKKLKNSPSKSSHHKEKAHNSHHTMQDPTKDVRPKANHSSHSNHKGSSRKSNASSSSSKTKPEPLNDFESALLGVDSYVPKPKKKKIVTKSKEKKRAGSQSSKASSSVEPSRSSRLPSFMNEGHDSSLHLSTSYKPMPQIVNKSYESTFQKSSEEEGLNYMYLAKNSRQKIIYTGKSLGKMAVVPSLFNQCIKVLQENIDALEYTGGIPYAILKPVLERATPIQLFNVENFNPYLLEDSSPLWEIHCKRRFKSMQREEMETYRDMFIRCTDEKEQRLKNVTEKLERKFVTKAAPKRTTQLAEFIGAPGRSLKKAKTQLVALQSKPSTSGASTSSSAVSKPPTRQPAAKKPKMGHMMAKSVQLYKKIFRR